MYAGGSLIPSATIVDRRERRLYHHPPNNATKRITQIKIPTTMPAFAPMLRPRLGADSHMFVGEVVGELEVEEDEVIFVEDEVVFVEDEVVLLEDEVVLVEEAEGLMLKLLLLMKLSKLCTPMK
jgi:hypothetical protein